MNSNQSSAIAVRELGRALVLDLRGDLTKEQESPLLGMRSWEEGLGGDKEHLILNLTDVTYINSSGIAILIRLVRWGAKGGYRTSAFGVTPHYQKLFRMVGLTETMLIYPNEYSALRSAEGAQELESTPELRAKRSGRGGFE